MSTDLARSNAAELAEAYEIQLKELLPEWRRRIEDLRATVRDQVMFGAQVGHLVREIQHSKREETYAYLRGLDPDLREDHIRIALQADRYRQKHPELDDVSQLTFALSTGEASPVAGGEPDQSRADSELAELIGLFNRASAHLTRRFRTPPASWDPAVRQSLKEQLRPFVELHARL